MKLKTIKYFVFLILYSQVVLFAQIDNSELMELSIEELLNVEVVTSNKTIEKILETPASVNVITDKEIEMLNFTNLQEVLEYSTGISSVNGEGNIFNTTTVRGNTLVNYNTNTLLLVDGIPIYSPYGGSFELTAIPLSSIERVEIVKGSNSVLYGSNAVNATINIITKKTLSYKDEKFSSKVLLGTNKTLYGNSAVLGKTGDFTYTGFIDYYSTKGELLTIEDERLNVIDFAQNKKTLSFIGKINYKDLVEFHVQTYNRNIPNYRTRGFQYIPVSDESVNFIPHRNDEYGFLVNGKFNYSFSNNNSIHFRSEYLNWELNRDNLYGTWNYTSTLFSNDLEYKFNLNSISSNIAGVSLNILNARRFKSEINDYDIGKDNSSTFDLSIFLNGSVELSDNFKLFYGGRYYSSIYKDVKLSDFSKRFALTYGINKDTFLKINYGESFRVPTYFEKEVNSNLVIGNPHLMPETSRSTDLIISHIHDLIRFDINLFVYDIHNKITRVTYEEDPSKKINKNIGTSLFYGAEFNSKINLNNNLSGFLGYSYTIGKDRETKERLKFTYRNMVNLGFVLKIVNQLNFTTSLKYLDSWGGAKSYILLNNGIKYKPWKERALNFSLQINNILNTRIDLPEIARDSDVVPTIPKTNERQLFVGVSYGM